MQFRNFIKLALASAVGVAAFQSMTAIAQEGADFNLASLNTNAWTHTAQPSAGIVFGF